MSGLNQISIVNVSFLHLFIFGQGVVFPPLTWGPEPHVLSVWVCRQEQLLSTDKSCVHHQPRSPVLLLLHRPLHRHGKFVSSSYYFISYCTVEFCLVRKCWSIERFIFYNSSPDMIPSSSAYFNALRLIRCSSYSNVSLTGIFVRHMLDHKQI